MLDFEEVGDRGAELFWQKCQYLAQRGVGDRDSIRGAAMLDGLN